jgi:hypothetical protein
MMAIYKETHGKELRVQKSNPLKFTKSTSPFEKDILKYMMGELTACP